MLISKMTVEHLDEVIAIERECFLTPWSEASFRYEIENVEISHAVVACQDGHVIGYGVAWCVADEIHVGNIAVRRDQRRRGIGRMLMKHILETGAAQRCRLATLEVRQSNLPAIELYSQFGFSSIAVRRGYYGDTGEHAIVMLKRFAPKIEPPLVPDLIGRDEEQSGGAGTNDLREALAPGKMAKGMS